MPDYVFPDKKLFPINNPEDIMIAIEAFHLFKDEVSYEDFTFRLARLASRKGEAFVHKLPHKIKRLVGFSKENRPEVRESHKNGKKPPTRFVKKERDFDED